MLQCMRVKYSEKYYKKVLHSRIGSEQQSANNEQIHRLIVSIIVLVKDEGEQFKSIAFCVCMYFIKLTEIHSNHI